MIKIGVLISGGGSNLQAIIDACNIGLIDGEVVFVGSDNKDAYGLKRAINYNIPTFTVEYSNTHPRISQYYKEDRKIPDDFDAVSILHKQKIFTPPYDGARVFFEKRAATENMILKNMAPYDYDILALAGFMRILTPYFIDRVVTDIINIHPSLLPAFPGTDGYGDTYRYGCKIGGCTVHYVDYGEDTGKIIGQKAYTILPEDTLEDVRKKGLALEHELYVEVLRNIDI